ncbi:MAG: DUF2384 domain-containing protein [Gammaproteobacteria bacterium]|nr:MAG: DUF2384 domain-containing protein [Gammaproteobacteria bacterium]
MNIADLARLAEHNQLRHEHTLVDMFDALRSIDPEVAEQTIYVFGDRTKAARWLTGPIKSLGGVRPLQVLAEGKREDVLRVLHQIGHGVYG